MSAENIIDNPPKVLTEPCEACGVSEFQLGVKHAEERIIKFLKILDPYIKRDELIKLLRGGQYESFM